MALTRHDQKVGSLSSDCLIRTYNIPSEDRRVEACCIDAMLSAHEFAIQCAEMGERTGLQYFSHCLPVCEDVHVAIPTVALGQQLDPLRDQFCNDVSNPKGGVGKHAIDVKTIFVWAITSACKTVETRQIV